MAKPHLTYLKKNYQGYLLMLPFLLVFFTFTVWPVVMSMGLSFTTYNVFEAPRFLGFENYVKLFFNDSVFLTAMQNTFLLSIIVGPLSYLLSLFLAWMVNEFRNPWRTILTVVFYAPTLSNAVFTIWLIVFDGDIYGYLNSILLKMGLISDPIQWTRDPKYMMMVVIIVQLWVSLGTSFLTLRAGFNTVDRQYYEAGSLDGIKNRFQELWYITLPVMKPQLLFGAVMQIVSSFSVADVSVRLAGFPSTQYAAETLVTHIMDYGTVRFEMGYACALACFLFALMYLANKLVTFALGRVGT